MKILHIKLLLIIPGMLLYIPSAFSHTSGEHSGNLLQQVMHILQSPEHLFILLALGILVSLLIRHARNKTDE